MSKKFLTLLTTLLMTASLSACSDSNTPNPTAIIETNKGNIEVVIFRNEVPEMAKNFIELAKSGKYDNTIFHRVVNEPQPFVIQGGDFENRNGTGGYSYKGPGTELKGEFDDAVSSNLRGTLSWANRGPDTNGSQFFINLADNLGLDHDKQPLTSQHPVFAKVTKGMEVVDKIAQVETGANDRPVEDVVITKVTVIEPAAE